MRISDNIAAVLNLIDVTLAKQDEDSRALANILTAVRGCDGISEEGLYNGVYYGSGRKRRNAIKKQTVGVIRAVAFPKTAASAPSGNGTLGWVTTPGATKIAGEALQGLPKHYTRHILQAADALGIEIADAETVLVNVAADEDADNQAA